MKRRLATLVVAASILGAAPAVVPVLAGSALAPATANAKSCSRGTHAVINGVHKCLSRGQYCDRASDRTYHRYGFHCHKQDANGRYHLT